VEPFPSGFFVNPIAIFVATRWELQAVRRVLSMDRTATVVGISCSIGKRGDRSYWLVQTGVGPDAAGRAAQAVLREQRMGLVLSTGFACALTDAAVGDVIIGTDVRAVHHEKNWMVSDESILCDKEICTRLCSVAEQAQMACKIGTLVSAPTVVWQAEEKRAIRQLTQAVGLDMESSALARVAQEQNVPVAIVRTVSDLIDEDLPLDFNLFLRPTGWMKGMQALARRPSSLVGLNRLRKQSRIAADRLSDWFQQYADAE
jgi:adenosylhomocysteine nucleosidase